MNFMPFTFACLYRILYFVHATAWFGRSVVEVECHAPHLKVWGFITCYLPSHYSLVKKPHNILSLSTQIYTYK